MHETQTELAFSCNIEVVLLKTNIYKKVKKN